ALDVTAGVRALAHRAARREAVGHAVPVAYARVEGRLAWPRTLHGIVAGAVVETAVVAVVRNDGRVLEARRTLHLDDVHERAVVVLAGDLFPVELGRRHVERRVGRVEVRRAGRAFVDAADVVVLAVDRHAARLDRVVVGADGRSVVVPRR